MQFVKDQARLTKNNIKTILDGIKNTKIAKQMLMIFFVLLVDICTINLLPVLLKNITDKLAKEGDIASISFAGFAFFICVWLAMQSITALKDIAAFKVINRLINYMVLKITKHIGDIPYCQSERLNSAKLITAINRLRFPLISYIKILLFDFFRNIIHIIAGICMMISLKIFSPLILVIIFINYIIFYFFIIRYLGIRNMAWDQTEKSRLIFEDTLQNISDRSFFGVKIMNYNQINLKMEQKLWEKDNIYVNGYDILFKVLFIIVSCIMLWGYIDMIKQGQGTVGGFLALKTYLYTIQSRSINFLKNIQSILRSNIDLSNMNKVLEIKVRSKGEYLKPKHHRPVVEIHHMSFDYNGKEIINNCNLKIYKGEKVLIEGKSGIGKTTLIKIITGFYRPRYGEVKIYGILPKNYSESELSKILYYIPQNKKFFTNTILYNLTLKEEKLEKKEYDKINFILKNLELADTISKLKNGIMTVIGNHDNILSTGERQRIIIARAIILKPKLLVIDEGLSALDQNTAKKTIRFIMDEIETVIISSHHFLHDHFDKVLSADNNFIIKKNIIKDNRKKLKSKIYSHSNLH